MKRWLILLYSIFAYAMFFGVFLYAVGFIGNLVTPTAIDREPKSTFANAICINAMLLTIFAVQHSLMARPFFKRWITRIIPIAAERSTYVLASNAAMILMFVFWQPLGISIWEFSDPFAKAFAYTFFFAGWALVFASTCMISHFDLFGLRQAWLYFRHQHYRPLKFRIPGLYRYVRHPLYVGWLMVIWATPNMTVSHLFFSIMTSLYIAIAVRFEERDLVDALGDDYRNYKRRVPMFVPRLVDAKIAESGVHSMN